MSRQTLEIEQILQQMIVEHKKLLEHVDRHQAAMKSMDLKTMDQAGTLQEACRLRISGLESRRKKSAQMLAKTLRLNEELTIARLCELFPDRKPTLLKLREDLRTLTTAISGRAHVGSRVAGTLLGHLNTAVRLLARAVEQAGVYNRSGLQQVTGRIGSMDAVG